MTFDPAAPSAQALAIAGHNIISVGADADITALSGPDTQNIDAKKGTVLPGFIDSLVHLFGGSVELDLLDLHGVTGLNEMRDKILPFAQANPNDTLVFLRHGRLRNFGHG